VKFDVDRFRDDEGLWKCVSLSPFWGCLMLAFILGGCYGATLKGEVVDL